MRAAPLTLRMKTALVLMTALFLVKVVVLRYLWSGPHAFARVRELVVGPVTIAVWLLVMAWVVWATFRIGQPENDLRLPLILMLCGNAFLLLLILAL